MTKILDCVYQMIWGLPMLVLIMGIGIYLSFATGFVQLRFFPMALKQLCVPAQSSAERVSGFQALCTALGATVGTGNLIGVAGAICLGGPGVVFWMWISAFLGMAVKYAEVTLSMRYRRKDSHSFSGGTMYIITDGLGPRWAPLSAMYCILGILASLGIGSAVQSNAITSALNRILPEPSIIRILIGITAAVLAAAVLRGGAGRVGRTAEILVPYLGAAYMLLCLVLLIARADMIPHALRAILFGAFHPGAAAIGLPGGLLLTLRLGCSRGIFSNEAGMGTGGMAHAAAEVSHPVQQGVMGILEVFVDTMLICTCTALVILCSGIRIPFGIDSGAETVLGAFCAVFGSPVEGFLILFIICFSFATILGWGIYGLTCVRFLFGDKGELIFFTAQMLAVLFGAVINSAFVWRISEILNGLMAIPNLLALAALGPEVIRLTREFESGGRSAVGGTYANIHQCQPL